MEAIRLLYDSVVTLLLGIPFLFFLFMFLITLKNVITGKREQSETKVSSGYRAMLICILFMAGIFFSWKWLVTLL
jgi:hypothetical protein